MVTPPSIDYSGSCGSSLFARWEAGEKTSMPAPLATRSNWYRTIIVGLMNRYATGLGRQIISLGAGNGFAEKELMQAGYNILATDISEEALQFCTAKGLAARPLNLLQPLESVAQRFDMAYADGLLGHLMIDPEQRQRVWMNLAALVQSGGFCLISNDLADDDREINLGVASDPNAQFLRPPAEWFATDAEATALWTPIWSRALTYRRPGRGLRRRELLVLGATY